ncbi:MAG: transcriptional regulator [Clostridia bacterium]|nr:transcriptional regulator [Clostridia bacterium]
MATSTEFKDEMLKRLSLLQGIGARKMMGEFLLYKDGALFGGLYDNRLLVKRTETNAQYNLPLDIPYAGAKPMLLVDTEDEQTLKAIIEDTVRGL